MCTSRTLYRDELNASVYSVTNGNRGDIVGNPELIRGYSPEVLDLVWHAVEFGNDDVKYELITLLADLDETAVQERVSKLKLVASPEVAEACDYFEDRVSAVRPGTCHKIFPEDLGESGSSGLDARDPLILLRMMTARNPHLDLGGGLQDDS